MKSTLLVILLSLSLFSFSAHAETPHSEQNQLQKKITFANSTLLKSREASKALRQKVRAAEDKLNIISNELHKTDLEISRLTTKLTNSNILKKKLSKQTQQQKNALAQQMQALYTSGKQSHLRLLLKQNDPSDISRTIKYFEYLNQHRLKRIEQIKKRLKKIKKVQAQINKDTKALVSLQKKQSQKKKELKKVVAVKEKNLKKQRKIVVSQEQKLAKLIKQESRLKSVIEKLARKQKREKLARELEQKKEAKKKTETKKQSKQTTVSTKKPKKTEPHYVPNKPFSSLKGKLAWPVRGTMLHKYGSTRNTKQKWKAVVISAPAGANVHAVARGKVEYSGRINGYGFVIIIRHDKNYRSLYGYNRSVFKKEGQIVKAGEIIAAVGNSGSIEKSGLYFEIRKSTTYQNPAKWCR